MVFREPRTRERRSNRKPPAKRILCEGDKITATMIEGRIFRIQSPCKKAIREVRTVFSEKANDFIQVRLCAECARGVDQGVESGNERKEDQEDQAGAVPDGGAGQDE